MNLFVQHISARIPWHDSGWNGTVCHAPERNAACVLLPSIGAVRDDEYERAHAGEEVHTLSGALPPCVAERGTFMSPHDVVVPKKHPYAYTDALKGIDNTSLSLPAWSVHTTPYYWMRRENVPDILEHEPVDFRDELEDAAATALKFGSTTKSWVLHGDNQRNLIETFYKNVLEGQSLVFFYLRSSPFDDAGKILAGAALIDSVQLPGNWPATKPTAFPNYMWETTLRHTLRPDGRGGLLLPTQQLARLAETGVDVTDALAVAPERVREFSYVTEHVGADVAVAALMELRRAADASVELGCPVPAQSLDWLDEQLNSSWLRRGVAPGLPAILAWLGFEYPTYAARLITSTTPDDADAWQALVDGLETGSSQTNTTVPLFTKTRRKIWSGVTEEQRNALRLLVRFDLTSEQLADVMAGDTDIPIEIDELLENPYYLVTCTLESDDPIPFDVVDHGCFGSSDLLALHPLPVTEPFDDPVDGRRLEALIASELAIAKAEGHTVVPVTEMTRRITSRSLVRPLPLTALVLAGLELAPEYFDDDLDVNWPVIASASLADGTAAYKLRSLVYVRAVIRDMTESLGTQPRHKLPKDLNNNLFDDFESLEKFASDDRIQEERARSEKRAALSEMYASRLTILNGPAGTGKTTLVKAIVGRAEIQAGRVLLLAPTGKARVQLEKKTDHPAQTLAQFLMGSKRYDGENGRYHITEDGSTRSKYGLVVVDEASMLTEDMLAALFDALIPPERLILVGDPRQLPPIGAGRPFVDLERSARMAHDGSWPQVAPGWAGLTVLRRQKGRVRDDLMLAKWFSGDEIPKGFDDVWERLRIGAPMASLRAVAWDGRTPEQVLEAVLAEELGVSTDDKGRSFAASYGATVGQYVSYYDAAKCAEKWQVLSPFRSQGFGTTRLNRHLKERFREFELRKALAHNWDRKVPKPHGAERIVLGDKVVNLTNQGNARYWSPSDGPSKGYLANGEIGVVIGQIKSAKMSKAPKSTQVEYTSQIGRRFDARGGSYDSEASLELAWALTVHKSQGSEFGLVILMLPGAARRVSRELLYTALTRQTDRVVICHEGSIDDLRAMTRASGSDTGRRMTDLTLAPDPVTVHLDNGTETFLDAGLIHVTKGGVLVRSKNEVIVAGILDDLAPGAWRYEQRVTAPDGSSKVPDFTITTADGRTVYWEHLGMLDDPGYAANWEAKLAWYSAVGITKDGGTKGTLLTTDDRGGVDEPAWLAAAEKVIGRVRRKRAVKTTAKRVSPKT